jgi:hypothetical protein
MSHIIFSTRRLFLVYIFEYQIIVPYTQLHFQIDKAMSHIILVLAHTQLIHFPCLFTFP